MKNKFYIISFILVILSGGCSLLGQKPIATLGTTQLIDENPLAKASAAMDQYVEVLARDWPKASAAIKEGLGLENMPKNIADQIERIDKLYQKSDGTWLTEKERLKLPEYTKWSAAFARLRHTGPVMRAIIQVHAPGLMAIPEVVTVLTFIGLGGL